MDLMDSMDGMDPEGEALHRLREASPRFVSSSPHSSRLSRSGEALHLMRAA
jgi:hypothetical protein